MRSVRQSPLVRSLNNALEGLAYVLKTQRNMRIHFAVAALILVLSAFLDLSRLEFVLLILAIGFVLMTELVNTAVEATIDVVTSTYDPLAKVAKDVAAAAVLLSTLTAAAVGYFVLFHQINPLTLATVEAIRSSPAHLTVISITLALVIVIVTKAIVREGTFLRGGWPSGHTAIAFSLATAAAFASANALSATLAFFLAAIVFHSRIEAGIHSFLQAFAGAVIGVLVTVLVFQASRLIAG